MKHSDFKIGMRFGLPMWGGPDKIWQVTDVGTRTVIAIRVVDGWMEGPPYALAEEVFDETDFPVCKLVA